VGETKEPAYRLLKISSVVTTTEGSQLEELKEEEEERCRGENTRAEKKMSHLEGKQK